MIINRTYRHDATFGCRIETLVKDPAPIKMHIGTMVDGWLDPRVSIDLTVANALNIIATLKALVDHADLAIEGTPISIADEHPAAEFGSLVDSGINNPEYEAEVDDFDPMGR